MSYDLRASRLLNAPIESVFNARTDPDLLRQLNDHPISRVSGELRIGESRVVEWGPDEDHLCRVTQVFREIEAPHRLVYTELLEDPPSPVYESVISELFAPREGKTLLEFHHIGFPTVEERDLHRQGYEITLNRLERYFARAADLRKKSNPGKVAV